MSNISRNLDLFLDCSYVYILVQVYKLVNLTIV